MYLFLDYDGVLNPDAVYLERRRPVLHAPGELFQWSPPLIEALEPFPEVQIVLSTSWVRYRGYSRAKHVLPLELSRRVVGATYHSGMSRRPQDEGGFQLPVCWWDRVTRYQQIVAYVQRAGVKDWLAIDDHPEGWAPEHIDQLILTTSERGIADPAALDLLKLRLTSIVADC